MKWKEAAGLVQLFGTQTWRIRQSWKYTMLDICIQYCFSKNPIYAVEVQRMVTTVGKDRQFQWWACTQPLRA